MGHSNKQQPECCYCCCSYYNYTHNHNDHHDHHHDDGDGDGGDDDDDDDYYYYYYYYYYYFQRQFICLICLLFWRSFQHRSGHPKVSQIFKSQMPLLSPYQLRQITEAINNNHKITHGFLTHAMSANTCQSEAFRNLILHFYEYVLFTFFYIILLTDKQTSKQTNTDDNNILSIGNKSRLMYANVQSGIRPIC